MEIRRIHIENFKSLIDVSIDKPNTFTVFAGPNGSGKSNLFEAIQLATLSRRFSPELPEYQKEWLNEFGSIESIRPKNRSYNNEFLVISFQDDQNYEFALIDALSKEKNESLSNKLNTKSIPIKNKDFLAERLTILKNCSRIFIGKSEISKVQGQSSTRLHSDASNLENVLKTICDNKTTKNEILEWLKLFIPELKSFEVQESAISGKAEIAFYEQHIREPLPRNLISDGSFNILALLTAVYQSEDPQFLLIEEPENGLNPYVVRQMVSFFREQCQEKGHYIWLNTHSQTLVRELKSHELILVDKINGETRIKQFSKDYELFDLEMDEAWLSNTLGGGVPW